jgi:hypothetical protein
MRCEALVTYGQIATGACRCGTRKISGCLELSWGESLRLKLGCYPLSAKERDAIRLVQCLLTASDPPARYWLRNLLGERPEVMLAEN